MDENEDFLYPTTFALVVEVQLFFSTSGIQQCQGLGEGVVISFYEQLFETVPPERLKPLLH